MNRIVYFQISNIIFGSSFLYFDTTIYASFKIIRYNHIFLVDKTGFAVKQSKIIIKIMTSFRWLPY